jgi:hypothetical protein
VERLVATYEQGRQDGEGIAAFLRRADAKELKAALADLEALTEESAGPEDFVDLGETETFVPIAEAV